MLASYWLLTWLFSECWNFQKLFLPNQKIIVKENSEYLGIFHLLEMNVSKLINYWTDMCWNGQGTAVLLFVVVLQ
jgi:hypothetical protein